MKKTRLSHRILAMLLVVLMTVQLLPLNAFADFGDLQSWNPGVDLSTLKKDDAINWPIRIYDYLSDGMLFEWFDTNTTTYSGSPYVPVGHTDGPSYIAPYGGGYKPPTTELGSDFTYAASSNLSSGNYNSPYYYSSSGCAVSLGWKDASDFKSPGYLRISDNTSYSGSGGNHNMLLNYFSGDQSTKGNMRYMVLVYRANKVEDYYCSISLSDDTAGSNLWDRNQVTIPDSSDWTYVIFDTSTFVSSSIVQWVWLTFHTTAGFNTSYKGMNSGAYLDLTHVGYFADRTAAENYAAEALKFDKNPGEYLAHQSTTTYTHSYVTPANRSDYLNHIFSLNYCWQVKDTTPTMFDAASNTANVRYGMDFTTHSTANGWKTNAYTSDTFWTWSNGTALQLKNTVNNVTRTGSFNMSKINVEQHTQTNGAQYVTLTTNGPSKILLSKFREDHQQVQEGYVPLTADVDYMVMVYRANGWTASDKYGLWAQGYLDSSSPDSHKTANYWKHAGLTTLADWTLADNINQLSFSGESGWQYVLIPISATIGEKDSNMTSIDRIANLGLYLPTLANGKSLDIAYVGYFKNNPKASDGAQFDVAHDFGTSAVNYMNAAAKVTQDVNTSKTYSNGRRWYGGGNKSFGMLYSSGGGQYWPSGNSGGESTSTDQNNYGYEFDTWMIGYRTNAQAGDAFNSARYQLVWNSSTGQYDKVKFTAKYTPAGTSTGHANTTFQAGATGTTNNIYFIAATEEYDENGYELKWGSNDGNDDNGKDFDFTNVPFDGYQLLQQMTSGVMTAGLLEGSLQTVVVNGVKYRVPVYRQETVEYIAYNLLHGLRVPMKDSSGNYNTRYIKGTESTKFGGVDLNGDGKIGWINYDGDSRNGNELNEASVDLATALRHELGLSPRLGNSVNVMDTDSGVDASYATLSKQMGNYQETLAKSKMLFGEFSDCRNAIDTAMDAAYYLLNNIFISESYNQYQDDYDYLTLSSATVNALGHSGFAYVFDAGFTTGKTASYGGEFTDDGTNKSAIAYSPYGTEGGTGTISMENVTGKTRFDYGKSSTSWTTRFPFLPVTDAEGDFAGQTKSYYFLDDAQRVYTEGSNSYKNRNFNYVIASNGEFVYREEDDLFFEFEGDDDVYLFINGELVLDIGGAHSITSIYIDVNDYVTAAAKALSELEKYGYHKDMSIDQFDKWISASEIAYLDSDLNPTGQTEANTYSAEKIAEFKRQHRLNLSDGQICQFDFYYMERHGWGANMRIVTNMHITDPSLSVEKKAYQFGEEIEYGGVIDPTSSVEYNFKLTNTGNTKLYNLNWRDDVLGITLNPTNGLTVNSDMNGIYVMNSSGGYLQAKDLTAIVSGTDINGNETYLTVSFDEVDGDGGQGALKKFLAKLESNDGTETGYDDAEVTNAGSGLWVGASVTFRGMFYMLTPEQTDAGMVDNTVYLTATTRIDPDTVGNRTLRSDASHRLYTNGFPIHYQWAGHNIFMNMEHLLTEAKKEADRAGSQLSLYQEFFQRATLSTMYTQPCDKFGRVGGDYSDFLTAYTDQKGHSGYLINYKKPGVYTFYLLMYMKKGVDDEGNTNVTFASSGVNASDIGSGYYAILRSQVFVADVKDSVYVLDYGLSTESLDAEGILFKDDYLFGPYGTIRAKLMGITGKVPNFIDPAKVADATKTGINFASTDGNRIYTADGFYNANLAIPEGGKDIAYDANTGKYTLTGVGTMKINAVLPTDMFDTNGNDVWGMPYLYYWYDDGTTGPAWPGTPLKKLGAGKYELDIPADVTNVIINNGSAALKTSDIRITPGLEATITVNVNNNNQVTHHVETIMEEVTMHVKVPSDWQNVYLHHWHDTGESTVFPGDQLTEKDENGYYTIQLHGDVSNLLITDGAGKQTSDLNVYAGKEAWIDVSDTIIGTTTDEDGNVTTTYYQAGIKYTLNEGFTVRATVPAGWKDTVYLYYWRSDGSENAPWPGKAMTKGDLWYTYDELVPADVTQIIINDGIDGGNHQTVNITISPGLETWVMVQNEVSHEGESKGKYLAKVAYGSETSSTGLTFTPQKFMDEENNMWMAITVHGTSVSPSAPGAYIDIHNEVHMYKKITVLPATVVYYEDTFGAVDYTEDGANSFTHHGNGSGQLSQSIDQDQPYGQDSVYQNAENELYSGDSLTEVEILEEAIVSTIEFKGTGFELIGRTNAFDAASMMARVYKKSTYTPDAYEMYMEKAQAYLDAVTAFQEIPNTYTAAQKAWKTAVSRYEEVVKKYEAAELAFEPIAELAEKKNAAVKVAEDAKAVLNAAKQDYENATAENKESAAVALANAQATYDSARIAAADAKAVYAEAADLYRQAHIYAYLSFVSYEEGLDLYQKALSAYNAALNKHLKTNESYNVCGNPGSCEYAQFESVESITSVDRVFDYGEKPTAPLSYKEIFNADPVLDAALPESPFVTIATVYNQFDHGNNGGAEIINQVPVIRVTDLELDEYVVEIVGLPQFIFDENNNYEVIGVQPTNLYLDGYRIYQPLGRTHAAYNDKEDNATIEELRDLIAGGIIGVGVLEGDNLSVNSGTTTWTESMQDNDFDRTNKETYHSIKVGSTADYLIQGPNNEVYMEGNVTNSALIFYVKKTDADAHELQIAVRGLDYGKYYGAGSTALNAQLQYGILTESGYAWKNLVRVVSGTEQYYSIPYDECPVDTQGRYQIVLRAINPQTNSNAMVSYTNLKLKGLTVEQVEGVGEDSVIYYQNGILVKPHYELVIVEDASFKAVEVHPFTGNQLTLTLTRDMTYVFIRSTLSGETYDFFAHDDPGDKTTATLWRYDENYGDYSRWTLDIPKGSGEITLTIKQYGLDKLTVSYCDHTYGEGVITREPNCTLEGVTSYTCSKCGYIKNEALPIDPDTHQYSGGVCIYCGGQEPKYYLVGYINGKNHGCEQDYTNMGDYLFVDGKLEVHFEKDSYVYVKADGNAAWYMTESYVTGSTAIMGNTATGAYTEKMYVPCGVDLLFTLTINDDNTVTLHYEEPCKHDWDDGIITKQPTCTEDGERSFTCPLCFSSKTEMIPAIGHNYVDGVCTNTGCGEILYRTIYFENTDNWENVYLYAWVENGETYTNAWPGDRITLVEGTTNIYTATVPAYLKVIFNDGGSIQTENLTIPEDADTFVWETKVWKNLSGKVDYYLVGNINGVDYGYGENSNNMGTYKFVDGKLTVSFTKESYVLVKTTGNAAWYMAKTYCDTYSATLYNTTTGAAEKMFVPAGAEIQFVLTVNDDDTLSLVAHSWGSVVTKDPTCEETGERTYTCYLCNDTYKEDIPALGHSFVDDVCSVCGEVDTRIVYFKNTAGWQNVYIYAFTEGTPATEYTGVWPGTQMSLVEGETDLYYYVLSAQAKSVIFNNGSSGAGNQTDNLRAPTDENNKYTYGANVWSPVDEEVELPEVEYLYFEPGDWDGDNAWFAAYFFGNGDAWVKLTDEDGDGIFRCEKPADYPNVIFCRMNKDMTDLGWDSKWNQTIDLTIPTDGSNFFTITNPWGAAEGKGDGVWSSYTCEHSYAAEVTTDPGCESTGVKTYTCSKCGDSYTEEIAATGHSYVDGSCTVCGGQDPEFIDKVYLQAGSDWTQGGAWFAAWFPGAETWATLSDPYGNGYYQCGIPEGATGVIFVRMNPSATAPSWNDGEKWNQTIDLSVEVNRLFVIENPWNESYEWKATGSWTDYNATVAECAHSYTEEITTASGCTSTGLKTFTCSKCSNSYTEEIGATGHNYVDGSCSNCGAAEPTEPVMLYLKPNSNWNEGNARFAANFYNDNGSVWVDMTDADGDGIYQCEAPNGYINVIYCRMNPGTTENNWTNKWNQTGDLTVLYNGYNLCTINDGEWDCGNNVTWSTYVAASSLSLRMTRSMTKAMSAATEDAVIAGDEEITMNLISIKNQMSSDVIYGQYEEFVPGDVEIEYEDVKINGAALVLSDDISMNYYVTAPEGAENVYMTFEMNGETTVVTDYTIGQNGRYTFCFTGINAQKMSDNVSATVYATVDGKQVSACVAEYSVRAYCVNQLNKYADDAKLVKLISDLLVYGEKTQIYQEYKTDELVTEGLELSPSTFTQLDQSFDKFAVTGTADASCAFSGVTLVLSNKVEMRLVIKTADPAAFTYRVNVAGMDYEYTAADLMDAGDGKYYLYFDELKATTFDQTVTANILRDGQIVGQTVTYSVNSYIYRNQDTEDAVLGQLLEAIYNYGHSAKEYVG